MNRKIFISLTAGLLVLSFCARGQEFKSDDLPEQPEKDVLLKNELRFRIGTILDAGITTEKIHVDNSDKLLPLNFNDKAYAVVRVKLDPGRSLSTHDFSMIHNYKPYKCIAIRPLNGSFNVAKRIFPPSKQSKIYDMLFVLSVPNYNSSIEYKCTLHYNLLTSGLTDVDVKFKNFNHGPILLKTAGGDK